jgi:hypothetical protein
VKQDSRVRGNDDRRLRRGDDSGAEVFERLVQFQPAGFHARELPAQIAVPRQRRLEAFLVFLEIGVRRGEPGVELASFARQRVELLFDTCEPLLDRLAQIRAPLAFLRRRPLLPAPIAAGGRGG